MAIDWFSLTIILSFIASALVFSFRAITSETNPFAFMGIAVGIGAVTLTAICHFKGISMVLPHKILWLAMMAGVYVALLDLGFIFMFRKGGKVSVVMPLFRVASIMLAMAIGTVFLSESVTILKFIGIIMACPAVYFLMTDPKEKVK